jgi:hypothetical protein
MTKEKINEDLIGEGERISFLIEDGRIKAEYDCTTLFTVMCAGAMITKAAEKMDLPPKALFKTVVKILEGVG